MMEYPHCHALTMRGTAKTKKRTRIGNALEAEVKVKRNELSEVLNFI
jgi:hypothetical protein